jgi:PIN domain nuclease of toxin-antitoxin system
VKLLLDTHAFLWFLADDRHLSSKARRRLEDPRNESFLSIVSVWEMAIKVSIGTLRLGDTLEAIVDRGARDNRIALLPVTKRDALAVAALPDHHRDPFDRMLVAQAKAEEMALVSGDLAFDEYGLKRIW